MRMRNSKITYFFLFFISLLFAACDKGYQVRFTNFYIEPMDSVVIGNNKIVYKNVALETTTEYMKLTNGKYHITFTTKTKKKFYSSIYIPKSGSGNRTIQIDAIEQIGIFEE